MDSWDKRFICSAVLCSLRTLCVMWYIFVTGQCNQKGIEEHLFSGPRYPWCKQSHLPIQTLWNERRGEERWGDWDSVKHSLYVVGQRRTWRRFDMDITHLKGSPYYYYIISYNYHMSLLSSSLQPSSFQSDCVVSSWGAGLAMHHCHPIYSMTSPLANHRVLSLWWCHLEPLGGRALQQQLVLVAGPGSSTDLLLLSHPHYP